MVHSSSVRYIAIFKWNNKTIILRSLAYILPSLSSLISTKLLRLVLHLAHPDGIFTSVYLDDLIIFWKSQKLTANHTKQVIGKFSQLAFTYRTTKFDLTTTQQI
ncbi:hypothetical protein V8B55DRAFT_1438556 [Mucor lusitanicus]|uniref:Reverse transcriptase domain-containing protein n=1 Tax=Mucor lusitanicus CBS 277.49 TaxID=747725 RepID=A0A162QBV1_MUCCL|nr:hypothetical protein MUCCIDRAFT_114119 [Mucor lusitanicus CBS 277.49]